MGLAVADRPRQCPECVAPDENAWRCGRGWPLTRSAPEGCGWKPARPPLIIAVVGYVILAVGVVVLLHAFVRFVTEGVGTPAPVAPTRHLVIGGLYRYVRNPMYIAVALTIVGQAMVLGRPVLLLYALVFGVAVGSFVHFYEQPTLTRQFGAEYEAYRAAVPPWLPRRRTWRPGDPTERSDDAAR